MQDNTKFRSFKAFRDYEQTKGEEELNPIHILALLKHSEGSMQKSKIAEELSTNMESLNRVLITLLQEGIVSVEPGPDRDPGKDIVKL